MCATFHVATCSTCCGEALISFGIPTVLPACRYYYSTWVASGIIITSQHGVLIFYAASEQVGILSFVVLQLLPACVSLPPLKIGHTYSEVGNRIKRDHLCIPHEATVAAKAFHCNHRLSKRSTRIHRNPWGAATLFLHLNLRANIGAFCSLSLWVSWYWFKRRAVLYFANLYLLCINTSDDKRAILCFLHKWAQSHRHFLLTQHHFSWCSRLFL